MPKTPAWSRIPWPRFQWLVQDHHRTTRQDIAHAPTALIVTAFNDRFLDALLAVVQDEPFSSNVLSIAGHLISPWVPPPERVYSAPDPVGSSSTAPLNPWSPPLSSNPEVSHHSSLKYPAICFRTPPSSFSSRSISASSALRSTSFSASNVSTYRGMFRLKSFSAISSRVAR